MGNTMRRNVEHTLIPARFFFTICHLFATFMVFYTMDQNILVSTGGSTSSKEYSDGEKEMQFLLAFSLLCFGVQLLGLCRFTAFFHRLNAFYIAIHVCGTVQCYSFASRIGDISNTAGSSLSAVLS